ncbi:hypothetical protein BOX15_Mlig000525g1 [Macrostomum lignano]|uniref:C-1-tetrahydrofolate synthase, cytoplasmic n=1 Tax=Macrostomum lignano TaxID=282301 RepID=A0A267GJR5_9PLAT|nr:hypothetical protein BOX15_Mlig000525g1 [Macrostomum lignano]
MIAIGLRKCFSLKFKFLYFSLQNKVLHQSKAFFGYTTKVNMAKLISGKDISADVKSAIKTKIDEVRQTVPNFTPGLAIVQVGDRQDSNVYIGQKLKSATEVGITAKHVKLGTDISESALLTIVNQLNEDPNVHGIIVQLPLDCNTAIDSDLVTNAIAREKDVDGLGVVNAGRLARGNLDCFVPCTPRGCLELIQSPRGAGLASLAGVSAVVVGRSKIVGSPMAELLTWHHATVTLCHSRTKDLAQVCRQADLLVVAIGRAQYVKSDWIKPGAIVIDCGINSLPDSSRASGYRLVGDVDFSEAKSVAGAITPVPGGVGPMTVAMLLRNTMEAALAERDKSLAGQAWKLSGIPPVPKVPVPSDIDISRSATLKRVDQLAGEIGVLPSELEQYGHHKAKISLKILDRLSSAPDGKLTFVTGITPTPLGEGKSTTTLGLVQAFTEIGVDSCACIRQPSQGPTFGVKGGAAGGGYSQVIPMDEFNLHLTGDIHAVTAANNLMASAIDTRLFHESTQSDEALYRRLAPKDKPFTEVQQRRLQKLGIDKKMPSELTAEEARAFSRLDIDPATITWQRVIDTSDRFLRDITIGQGPNEKSMTRRCKFDISVASEIMAVLALSTSLADLKQRLGRMVFGLSKSGAALTADDLGVTGALCVLLKDCLKPNLMQTLAGGPCLVHCGPFANIAHGNSSVVADQVAMKLVGPSGFAVTESGFGSDMGFEKGMHIKCRSSGLQPHSVVLVATVRALKYHGGGPKILGGGAPLPDEYRRESVDLVVKGCENLAQHVAIVRSFNLPVVVAVNKFGTDTPAELEAVVNAAKACGAADAVICNHWAEGGRGADALARALMALPGGSQLGYLYSLDDGLEAKMTAIAKRVYGADGVQLTDSARQQLDRLTELGYANLPVCMAKTNFSLSDNPSLAGRPTGFTVCVSDLRLSAGAGFVFAVLGSISLMPGLPTRPCFYDVDLDCETGEVLGLM